MQNLLETYTTVTVATLITGLWNPRVALGISIAYSIGAYGFAKGYATGKQEKKNWNKTDEFEKKNVIYIKKQQAIPMHDIAVLAHWFVLLN